MLPGFRDPKAFGLGSKRQGLGHTRPIAVGRRLRITGGKLTLRRYNMASREVERAMGTEPTRETPPELENKRFGAMANAKCDRRVNFPGTRGHVG